MDEIQNEGSPPQITEVKLKNGKKMFHVKSKDGRHLFFNNLVAVNVWMGAVLVFILLTSIMMSYSVALQVREAGNMILQEIRELRTELALSHPGEFNLTTNDSIYLQPLPKEWLN